MFLALLTGCGGSPVDVAAPPEGPPEGLVYRLSSVVYPLGVEITPNTPQSSGGAVTQYSVTPDLPAGLSLNSQTGIMTGTPTEVSNIQVYTVTGSNSAGSVTARLTIEVSATVLPPESLRYSAPSIVYETGTLITPNQPTNTGGEITQYSIDPPLPVGLNLDPQTGVISGTPMADAQSTPYTVTGSNSAGNVTAQLIIGVHADERPTVALEYRDRTPVYAVGQTIQPNEPTNTGGQITRYSVSPALPEGLSLSTNTGRISGTPRSPLMQATWTVTGHFDEDEVTTQIQITVEQSAADWRPANHMTKKRTRHTATWLKDHQVLLVVGGQHDRHTSLNDAELYNPENGQWSVIENNMKDERYDHTATRLENDMVLVAGGRHLGNKSLKKAELYDPVDQTWSDTAEMKVKRHNHTATLLKNGKVLVAGGDSGDTLSTSELYNPEDRTWSETQNMPARYIGHTATRLKDGRVLVAGGGDSTQSTQANAALYDPERDTWSTTSDMAEKRSGHTATLLGDEEDEDEEDKKVLVAGGENDNHDNLLSAELYCLGPVDNQPE
ncbi:hypothetical protein DFQ30_010194 [Apophysomyces sp. BC1015]|nr:hypothetical protein DFQ30_010194 [Apophysomyces sp. BC1015]